MASFSSNRALLLSLLVAVSGFMAAPSSVEAQIIIPGIPLPPIFPTLPGLLNISGTVFCTPNVTVSSNGTVPSNAQPVSNATVMLRCGNSTVANTTTTANGTFGILSRAAPVIQPVVSFLLGGGSKCQLIVPLSMSCNVTLPATTNLVSDIRSLSAIPFPGGGILNIVSGIFRFLA